MKEKQFEDKGKRYCFCVAADRHSPVSFRTEVCALCRREKTRIADDVRNIWCANEKICFSCK